MLKKQELQKKAFDRNKESRTRQVNFKDCRPNQSLEAKSMLPGEKGFVKHVGDVRYIDKSNLQI
jgi:hypothetical protein